MALPLIALKEAIKDPPSATAAPTRVVVLPERTAPAAAATGETREEKQTGYRPLLPRPLENSNTNSTRQPSLSIKQVKSPQSNTNEAMTRMNTGDTNLVSSRQQ